MIYGQFMYKRFGTKICKQELWIYFLVKYYLMQKCRKILIIRQHVSTDFKKALIYDLLKALHVQPLQVFFLHIIM